MNISLYTHTPLLKRGYRVDALVNLLVMEEEDLYETLGLKSSATKEDIKQAYRRKALQYHPDKHPSNPKATALFQHLAYAYKVLSETTLRARYDTDQNLQDEIDFTYQDSMDAFFSAYTEQELIEKQLLEEGNAFFENDFSSDEESSQGDQDDQDLDEIIEETRRRYAKENAASSNSSTAETSLSDTSGRILSDVLGSAYCAELEVMADRLDALSIDERVRFMNGLEELEVVKGEEANLEGKDLWNLLEETTTINDVNTFKNGGSRRPGVVDATPTKVDPGVVIANIGGLENDRTVRN